MTISKREAYIELMEHAANHDAHGYSQDARWGNGKKEMVTLSDGTQIAFPLGDFDCSSIEIVCLRAVGINTNGASYTGNLLEEVCHKNSDIFEWHPMGDGYIAQRSDIYLNKVHHTGSCTSPNPDMLVNASISENGTVRGKEGDQTGREIYIRPYYDYPWDGKIAWKNDGGPVNGVTPAYSSKLTAVASAVIDGAYGNGDERRQKLSEAGFDPDQVQREVNRIMAGGAIQAAIVETEGGYSPGEYFTIVDELRVRTGPGIDNPIKTKSQLTPNAQAKSNIAGELWKNTNVTVSEIGRDSAGNPWGKIPSGWICLEWEGKPYVAKH